MLSLQKTYSCNLSQLNRLGWCRAEEGSSMDTSLGSTRKSTMNEADEDQEGHESES